MLHLEEVDTSLEKQDRCAPLCRVDQSRQKIGSGFQLGCCLSSLMMRDVLVACDARPHVRGVVGLEIPLDALFVFTLGPFDAHQQGTLVPADRLP